MIRAILLSIAGAVLLVALTWDHFLLFHTLAEIFSVIISFAIFFFGWNSRGLHKNRLLSDLGLGYFFVGFLDLAHTLTYEGMNIFPGLTANTPTQFWLVSRYLEVFIFAKFYWRSRRSGNQVFSGRQRNVILAGFSAYTLYVFLDIGWFHFFPDAFQETTGLTHFKIICELLIVLALLLLTLLFWRIKHQLSPGGYRYFLGSLGFMALSEICFTLYSDPYDIFNRLGHVLKIISFYLVYRYVVVAGFLEQVEELNRLLGENRAKNREVLRLSNRLISYQENLHEQTARELHDSIGQLLARAKLELDLVARSQKLPPTEVTSLKKVAQLCAVIDQGLSNVYTALYPATLDEMGLREALEELLEQNRFPGGPDLEAKLNFQPGAVESKAAKLHIYRIVQESLSNSLKHSGAAQVWVVLKQFSKTRVFHNFVDNRVFQSPYLLLTIQDNGRGLPGREWSGPESSSLGFRNLEYRVGSLNGKLRVSSWPGYGTKIRIMIPLNQSERSLPRE